MLPNGEESSVILTGNGNFRGTYTSMKVAARVYSELCGNSYIDKEKKKWNFERIEKDRIMINAQIRSRFKGMPALIKNQELITPKIKECNKFLRMLEDAKRGKPTWKKAFHSETARFFNTLAFPDYKLVLRIDENRKNLDLGFVKKTGWIDRTNEELSATEIDSATLLKSCERNGSKPKSIFASNQLAIPEIPNFIHNNPSIESVALLVSDVMDDEDYFRVGVRKGINPDKLRQAHQDILDSVEDIKKEFGGYLNLRIQFTTDIFCADPLLVITDLDLKKKSFKLCISTDSMEALYKRKCRCRFYSEPDKYLLQVIDHQIKKFDTEEIE